MSADSKVMELRTLLGNLVACDPTDGGFCVYCSQYQDHADDCPWAVAQGYLEGGPR